MTLGGFDFHKSNGVWCPGENVAGADRQLRGAGNKNGGIKDFVKDKTIRTTSGRMDKGWK